MTVSERASSPTLRHAAVLALYGAFAGAAGLAVFGGLHEIAGVVVILALGAVGLASLCLLFFNTGYWRWGNAPDPYLDEFEILRRNAAYLSAYRVIGAISVIALVSSRLAKDNGWRPPTGLADDMVFLGWMLLILTLPSALIAWGAREAD